MYGDPSPVRLFSIGAGYDHLPAGVVVSLYDVLAIVIAIVVCGGFMAFFRFTSIGLQMRATAESPKLAGNRGVNVRPLSQFPGRWPDCRP